MDKKLEIDSKSSVCNTLYNKGQYFDKIDYNFKLNESKMKLKHVATPF